MTPETASPPTVAPEPHEFTIPPDRLPDVSNLVIRDDTPVESFFAEKQYRLLTGPLQKSWGGPPGEDKRFIGTANVGFFFKVKEPPLVPDVMLSVGVELLGDPTGKENKTYFLWEFGKPPDVVIEVVSDRRGGEDTTKFQRYAHVGVPYYVIFDPEKHLSEDVLRSFVLRGGIYEPCPSNWFPRVGLGVTLWESTFENHPSAVWLRWCDEKGDLIPTDDERAEQEKQRAEQEKQRAEQEKQRAEQEKQRAEQQKQRADRAEELAARMAARLRELGINPETL